ncbi:MAG: hypothetical protein GY798_08570 [Hyphomicrobiales bacterium]|nr:hypothetical protein [Hyphomicrobiales bacterium]
MKSHMRVKVSDSFVLEGPAVEFNDENLILEIYGAIESERADEMHDETEPPTEKVSPAQAALDDLTRLVGSDAIARLCELLSRYSILKRFYKGVLQKPEEVRPFTNLHKSAKQLLAQIEAIEQAGLKKLVGLSPKVLTEFKSTLGLLVKANASPRKVGKDLRDLDNDLIDGLIQWWTKITEEQPTLWSTDTETHSPFIRFARSAIAFLDKDVQPTESRGTAGYGRNALKRRRDKGHERQEAMKRYAAWLQRNKA